MKTERVGPEEPTQTLQCDFMAEAHPIGLLSPFVKESSGSDVSNLPHEDNRYSNHSYRQDVMSFIWST